MRSLPITLLLVLFGCTPAGRTPSEPLPLDRFAAAYATLLEATLPPGRDSVAATHSVDSVLALRAVTRDQFNATVAWCNEDIVRWNSVLDEVVRILEEKAKDPTAKRTAP
jgi:hypothetical protein